MEKAEHLDQAQKSLDRLSEDPIIEAPINVSGHRQELDRNFSLLSLCGFVVTSGCTWTSLGGSIVVAIYNGGPPGVIYELFAVEVFYWMIAASIAELASAMPSAGGVYHWASITAGRHGRICGWFAGWWNVLAWILGIAAMVQIAAAQAVSMYALFHPSFTPQRWHVFVAYLISTWMCAFPVLFANKILPMVNSLAGVLTVTGVLITIIICAIMPHQHATNSFIWRDWQNTTGYESNGFVFLLGMLNGAFSIGTPDVCSHLAEEVPNPSANLPKAILAQYVCGLLTALFYLIAILYGISDLPGVLNSTYLFPLTDIYRQVTNSAAGAFGLLLLAFVPSVLTIISVYITVSRGLWTLARDNAAPFSPLFGRINHKHRNPFNSILLCAIMVMLLGFIYLGSSTAFNAFVGSFVMFSSLSYLMAILPHLLSKRSKITPGWFWMKGITGFVVNGIACLYIVAFTVIFSFPFSLPVTAGTMNYTSLITGGLSLFIAAFWFQRKRDYVGPQDLRGRALAEGAM